MKTLRSELLNQTAELKTAFIEQVKKWAATHFDFVLAEIAAYHNFHNVERLAKLNGEPLPSKNEYWRLEKYCYRAGYKIKSLGLEGFIAKSVKDAEEHYTQSIEKLVFRLESKGLTNDDNFEMISGRVGVNFETTIKHAKGTTRAFTVLAEGAINRPHYRYLVK